MNTVETSGNSRNIGQIILTNSSKTFTQSADKRRRINKDTHGDTLTLFDIILKSQNDLRTHPQSEGLKPALIFGPKYLTASSEHAPALYLIHSVVFLCLLPVL